MCHRECVYEHIGMQVLIEARKGTRALELELWTIVSCLTWVLGDKFRPLQEQYTLLTEASDPSPNKP